MKLQRLQTLKIDFLRLICSTCSILTGLQAKYNMIEVYLLVNIHKNFWLNPGIFLRLNQITLSFPCQSDDICKPCKLCFRHTITDNLICKDQLFFRLNTLFPILRPFSHKNRAACVQSQNHATQAYCF